MKDAAIPYPRASSPSDPQVLALFQDELARIAAMPGLAAAGRPFCRGSPGVIKDSRLPRRLRRQLQRRWRRSLAAIALLLALGQASALAATINVDGASCTLVDAVTAANTDAATGGCTAGSGADTLVLAAGSTHTLIEAKDSTDGGPTDLPAIASVITIEGNGSTIRRDPSVVEFCILAVRFDGNLTLQETTVSGGLVLNGHGGGVHNRGTLSMVDSTVSGNSAGSGGGLYNFSTATLLNSTVSGNSATVGGGLANANGTRLILAQTLISGNTASRQSDAELTSQGTVIANGFNLCERKSRIPDAVDKPAPPVSTTTARPSRQRAATSLSMAVESSQFRVEAR